MTSSVTIEAGDNPVSISVDEAGVMTIEDATADRREAQSAQDRAQDSQSEETAAKAKENPREAIGAGPLLPHDLSPWGMFMQADWVVKAVMMGLVLASIATWTVLVAKTRELRVLVRRQRQTLAVVSDAHSLKAAHQALDEGKGAAELTGAAARELHLSANTLADTEGVKERIASSLERLEAASGRNITKGTSILATIGATAPFIGLFGTVWGIMNSFIGISKAQTTNLAVVAPGIAEALLATALGLVAAIPAVVIYNHFARQIGAYRALLGDTSAAVLRLVSRDLSHHTVSGLKAVGEG
ncbi:MAG: tonB-system energizer ExbB [Parahaliea sp.]